MLADLLALLDEAPPAYPETPPHSVKPFPLNFERFNAEFGKPIPPLSQEDAILVALVAGNRITTLEALRKYGCLRLGARIYDLRKRGYQIIGEKVKRGGKWVAEYHMEKAK